MRLSLQAPIHSGPVPSSGDALQGDRSSEGRPYVAQFVKLLLEGGEPVMLFGNHRDVYTIWERVLREHKPILYTGSENPKEKERNKQAFMGGESNLLICSLKSGVGLDGIQERCKLGVIGELDWSPAVVKQCIGRLPPRWPGGSVSDLRDGQRSRLRSYMMQTLGIKRLQVEGVVLQDDENCIMNTIESAQHLRILAQNFLKGTSRPCVTYPKCNQEEHKN